MAAANMKSDKRIDTYIARSAEFAQPILMYLRKTIHKACPDVTETVKWGFPHFEFHGILCSMAAFKQHCAFTFWKGSLIQDSSGFLEKESRTAMGHLGRITSLKDLPPQAKLVRLIREAMRLNREGVRKENPARVKPGTRQLRIPAFLSKALRRDAEIWAAWQGFSYSHQKEYIEYISEAKTEETRERRLLKTLEQIREKKSLNWKYTKR